MAGNDELMGQYWTTNAFSGTWLPKHPPKVYNPLYCSTSTNRTWYACDWDHMMGVVSVFRILTLLHGRVQNQQISTKMLQTIKKIWINLFQSVKESALWWKFCDWFKFFDTFEEGVWEYTLCQLWPPILTEFIQCTGTCIVQHIFERYALLSITTFDQCHVLIIRISLETRHSDVIIMSIFVYHWCQDFQVKLA